MARSTHSRFSLAQPLEILLPGENLGLEPAQGVGARRLLLKRSAADTACIAGSWANRSASLVSSYPAKRLLDRLAQ